MGLCYECAEMVIGAGMGWRNKKSLLNSLLYQIGIAEGSIIGPFDFLINIHESSLAMEMVTLWSLFLIMSTEN